MGKMKVSVIIRVHSYQPYLSHAIQSVLKQKTDFEFDLWLVLDRPSVEVLSELKSMPPQKFKTFFPKSEGFSSPINELLVQIRSDYVAILDADDMMNEGRLQLQHDFLEENKGVAVLGSGIILIDENGFEIGRKRYSTNSSELREKKFVRLPVAHPAVMFRRLVILECGSYRSFYDFAEDYDLWLRVFELADVVNLEEFLTYYRIHSGQTNARRIKQNVLAGVAARKSGVRRKKGLSDYSVKYANIQQLMSIPSINLEVGWRTLERQLFKGLSHSLQKGNRTIAIFYVLLLSIVNPLQLFKKIRSYRYE